jgi:hypothetical protein
VRVVRVPFWIRRVRLPVVVVVLGDDGGRAIRLATIVPILVMSECGRGNEHQCQRRQSCEREAPQECGHEIFPLSRDAFPKAPLLLIVYYGE